MKVWIVYTHAAQTSGELTYNALGQLTQKTHFDGSQTTWEYGAAATGATPNPAWGQITREHRADGSSQSRSYDSHGRHNQTIDSRDGTETRNLDALGQVTSRNVTHSGAQLAGSTSSNVTTHYQWDARGQRTQLRTPASASSPEQRVTSTWDAAGQLSTLQASSDVAAHQFTHDAAGRLAQIQRSDGSQTRYQYNPDGHISQIRHQDSQGQPLAQFDYQHNRDGQRTQAVETIHSQGQSQQRTISYQYDSAGKLTQEHIQQSQPTTQTLTIAYQYDKVGNRTARTVTGAIQQTTTYQYDQNDRLTQSSDSLEGTTSYRYDLKGNLVEKANGNNTTKYSYNSDNRLIKVEHSNSGAVTKTTTYGYDPQGRRIKKLVLQGQGPNQSKTETHYNLDSERAYHEIVVEWTSHNNGPWIYTTYLHTPEGTGQLISQSEGTTTKQIYTDAQGSTRLITDSATGASQSYSFDAFGNWLAGDAINPNSNAPTHLYTGERFDADTGLIYLRARDYDPATGRFISMDEHPGNQRIPLTLNKYLYANADPVNHVDPSGYMLISVSMPSFQSVLRFTSHAQKAMGILEKVDKALMLMQIPSVANGVWNLFSSGDWRDASKKLDVHEGENGSAEFMQHLSNFDQAVYDFARNAAKAFSYVEVQRQLKSFLQPQKNNFKLVIYAPTPYRGGWISGKNLIKIGQISLSKLSREVVLDPNKVGKQGGRMLGIGHASSKNTHTPWFRQDWHRPHGKETFLSPPYHYHVVGDNN